MMLSSKHNNSSWKHLACTGLGVALTCGVALAQGTTDAGAQPAAPTASENAADLSFFQLLLKGGFFMIPIALTSLLGLAIVFERWLALRSSKVVPKRFVGGLRRVARDREAALEYCRVHDSPAARVIAAGVRKMGQGEDRVERAMEDAGAKEIGKLRRNLRMLYGISVAAPMMGLVGTVWGMIHAFRVTASAGGIGRPELLAKGIYEALVATLCGLAVAIPALILYYYFIGKIEKIVNDMNDVTQDFLDEVGDGVAQPAAARKPAPARTVVGAGKNGE